MKKLILILGNQLFNPQSICEKMGAEAQVQIFMREDAELCSYYRFHKQKIIFFLGAMRQFANELRAHGFEVHYEKLIKNDLPKSFEDSLRDFIQKNKFEKICFFEIEDKFFEKRLRLLFKELALEVELWPSPMFLTSRRRFSEYLGKTKKPFMKTFYQSQRSRLGLLMDSDGEPLGGRWSFDEENRKALPKSVTPPPLPAVPESSLILEVSKVCESHFPEHPGKAGPFWLPVDRAGAQAWLEQFVDERLAQFGPYEDAIPPHSEFLFHSVLTPFLNTGLLTPREVVSTVLKKAKKNKIELASLEGFIRQIVGWREFVRGIYQNFSDTQEKSNFWQHKMKLSEVWYQGGSGVPPLDRVLEKVIHRGYLHHIERLMVVGSLMLLLEVDPQEGHRWFMEMFIDSSDWVMGPNVYGMALFSDGGIFATKPYICGSNYYRKMSGEPKGDWCEGVDGLYWSFIEKHQDFFLKNPRLSMMARMLQKMDPGKLKAIKQAAIELRTKLVVPA